MFYARRNWRLGVLMLLVLSAHNFPEGLAVAASAMDSSRLGIIVAVAIAAHNIPEVRGQPLLPGVSRTPDTV